MLRCNFLALALASVQLLIQYAAAETGGFIFPTTANSTWPAGHPILISWWTDNYYTNVTLYAEMTDLTTNQANLLELAAANASNSRTNVGATNSTTWYAWAIPTITSKTSCILRAVPVTTPPGPSFGSGRFYIAPIYPYYATASGFQSATRSSYSTAAARPTLTTAQSARNAAFAQERLATGLGIGIPLAIACTLALLVCYAKVRARKAATTQRDARTAPTPETPAAAPEGRASSDVPPAYEKDWVDPRGELPGYAR